MKEPNLRILIGLREIAGFCGRLKHGFDEIGVTAHFLDLGGNHLNYDNGKNPAWIKFKRVYTSSRMSLSNGLVAWYVQDK